MQSSPRGLAQIPARAQGNKRRSAGLPLYNITLHCPSPTMQSATRILQPTASTSKLAMRPAAVRHARSLASHAYRPSAYPAPSGSRTLDQRTATTSTPRHLTPEQRQLLERTIRVDQAGELGANWIYRGQKLVMELKGDKKTAKQIEVCLYGNPVPRAFQADCFDVRKCGRLSGITCARWTSCSNSIGYGRPRYTRSGRVLRWALAW